MEKYWSKHFDFPSEVTAVDVASDDESEDEDTVSTKAKPTASNPIASDDENETPDVAYARFRAERAA